MKKGIIWLIVSAILAGTGIVLGILLSDKRKKSALKEAINEIGGLAYYNFAAGTARKKGLIEADAKLSSIDEIDGLDKNQVKLVAFVLDKIYNKEVSVGPARDKHGNFIKKEGE